MLVVCTLLHIDMTARTDSMYRFVWYSSPSYRSPLSIFPLYTIQALHYDILFLAYKHQRQALYGTLCRKLLPSSRQILHENVLKSMQCYFNYFRHQNMDVKGAKIVVFSYIFAVYYCIQRFI